MTEILICGGGVAGAGLACALSNLSEDLSIIILEKELENNVGNVKRGEAIRPEVTKILEKIGLLDHVKQSNPVIRPEPREEVWHSSLGKMGVLDYNILQQGYPMLYLPHSLFVRSLHDWVKGKTNVEIIYGAEAFSIHEGSEKLVGGRKKIVSYRTRGDGTSVKTNLDVEGDLVVVADGGSSSLRSSLGIQIDFFDYKHGYLMVILDKPEEIDYGRHCLSPYGFVGLFSMPQNQLRAAVEIGLEELSTWLSYDRQQIKGKLQSRLPYIRNLGVPRDVGIFYRVIRRQAREYIRDGIALVGDAAHTTHPMLGQGMSMVFNDIFLLSDFLTCHPSGPFDVKTLKEYELKAKNFSQNVIENNDYAYRTFDELGIEPSSLKDRVKELRKIGFLENREPN